MSKLSKVLAVAAIAGSAAWVGHQVVRHHHKAAELRHEFHALAEAHHEKSHQDGGDQVHAGSNNARAFEEKDFGQWGKQVDPVEGWHGRHHDDVKEWRGHHDEEEEFGGRRHWRHRGDDDEEFGGRRHWRRRHSDDFGRRHGDDDDEREGEEHHRRHRRRHSDDFSARRHRRQDQDQQQQQEPEYQATAAPAGTGAPVDASVPDVEAAAEPALHPLNLIRFPASNEESEVPALEENNDDIRFPPQDSATTTEIRFPPVESEESLSASGNQRHHARRHRRHEQDSQEVHFREFDHQDDEFTAEERAEFRRLRKEARRLHCEAARTAGGFVAGAAFVGGVAHLRRLRRERRQARAAAGEAGQVASCPSQTA
jgi:hypothetical protein